MRCRSRERLPSVTPLNARFWDPKALPEAIRYLRDGHERGKVVITV
jgi:hypothetical protein